MTQTDSQVWFQRVFHPSDFSDASNVAFVHALIAHPQFGIDGQAIHGSDVGLPVSLCEAARKRIVISDSRDVSKTKARLTKTRGAQRRKRLNLSFPLCAPRVLVSRATLFYFRSA
jgi:hypothetical protein